MNLTINLVIIAQIPTLTRIQFLVQLIMVVHVKLLQR